MREDEYQRNYNFEDCNWWFVGMRNIYLTLLNLLPIEKENIRVLDVGCGTGGMLRYLRSYGFVFGCDVSIRALQFCKRRGERNIF